MSARKPLSERIYRRLVRCLPLDFRVDHQEEMEQFFRLERRQAARGGGRRLLGLWLRALADLARGVVREHADAFVQDARLTARSAVRRPGFTLAVVATLALALGANTAMFGVVHTVLLRPLPFADEARLVRLYDVRTLPDGGRREVSFSRLDLDAVARQAATLTSVTGQVFQGPALRVGGGAAERVTAIGVSGSWFRTLGVHPALGREWNRDEEAAEGDSRVVLLSDGLWRRRFGADPGVLGSTVHLDGEPYTVLGVMPQGFTYPYGADLWRLWTFDPTDGASHTLNAQARLAPGVSLPEAQAELDLVSRRLERAYPDTNRGYRILARPTRQVLYAREETTALFLFVAVGFVLLIAAVNVVALLLARTVSRSRELAVRASLGASSWRRARQLVTENTLLALAGGALGLAFAGTFQGPLLVLVPHRVTDVVTRVPLDGPTLWFTLVVSLAVGVAIGLAPALASRSPDLKSVLQEGGEHGTARGRRLLGGLVLAEVALSVVLVLGAALMASGLYGLLHRDLGFEPKGLLSLGISLPEATYSDPAARARVVERITREVRELPGVSGAAVVNIFPFSDGNFLASFRLEGEELSPDQAHSASYRIVSPGYFETARIPVLDGRRLEDSDRSGSPSVAVVDLRFAERYWPGKDLVGRRVVLTGGERSGELLTVVGVVGNVEDPLQEPAETLYVPQAQSRAAPAWDVLEPHLVVRTATADPSAVVPAVRDAVGRIDPDVPVFGVETAREHQMTALGQLRTGTALILAFSALGLLLSAVGVHGVTAYGVSRRTRELGVRMALGAGHGTVLSGVLATSGRLVGGGIALGFAGALALSRVLGAVLPPVPGVGAPTLGGTVWAAGGVAALLAAVGLAATLGPALRATRTDPVQALKTE